LTVVLIPTACRNSRGPCFIAVFLRVQVELLHPVADAVIDVLCFDDGYRNVGLVIQDVIGALGFAKGNELSAEDDAPLGEGNLIAELHHPVPARAFYGGAYELGADIAIAEVFFVHKIRCGRILTSPWTH
jgi:hypothetical protein